jgi:hypothetical protein
MLVQNARVFVLKLRHNQCMFSGVPYRFLKVNMTREIKIQAISTKNGIFPERTKLCQQNGHSMWHSVLVNEYMKGEYMVCQVC